ncbi:MAG TPA: hypothetical protein VGR89_15410 [Puia sp.]|nr:hypothetical protein [Puia sp.]
MKAKICSAAVVACTVLLYFSGCAKRNGVEAGAGTCDTTAVRYSTQVLSILQNNCYTCHNGPGASSGIDLSNFDAFKGWAGSGYVTADITGAPGHIQMPYGLPRLSECDINTIMAWIHQGMPNN